MCLASFGGSARIATHLATALSQRNHTVHLFSRTPPFDDNRYNHGRLKLHTVAPAREAELHPARLHVNWTTNDYRAFLTHVLACIAHEGLDILHFHYAVPFAFVAAEVKHHLGQAAPLLVGTLHGTDVSIFGRDPGMSRRLSRAFRNLDGLTTVSFNNAQLATDLFKLPVPPLVIPDFIDLTQFRPLPVGQPNGKIRAGRPRIAHVSNFRPVKDTPSVARIFAGIRRQIDAELWLIGEGPDMDQVKAILQASGVEQDVRYWGLQQDVGSILAQSDLLLMTSRAESFCLAALEAMACGVPVLSTGVGGLPEVVIDGKTGCLFPPNEHDQAVQLAVELLSDPLRHRAMRAAAINHAARFNYHRIVPRYENLYQVLMKRRTLPAVALVAQP